MYRAGASALAFSIRASVNSVLALIRMRKLPRYIEGCTSGLRVGLVNVLVFKIIVALAH
jgi:hypothetical protein